MVNAKHGTPSTASVLDRLAKGTYVHVADIGALKPDEHFLARTAMLELRPELVDFVARASTASASLQSLLFTLRRAQQTIGPCMCAR